MIKTSKRNIFSGLSGIGIGTLGRLIGLGGAEFRLPLLVGFFSFASLDAVIINKMISLVVVASSLPFAAVLGVAGGELIIPTLVLLFGVDIKLAGSLSLCISLPTMIVAFFRYTQSGAVELFKREKQFLLWMAIGSIIGSAIGGRLIGIIPSNILVFLLGAILLISAVKTFKHSLKKEKQ